MSKLDEALDRLRRAAGALELDALEDKRAARSVDKVHDRLQRREYQRFAFDGNVFDVPDRVKELLAELEFYCAAGKTWARILDAAGATREPQVVDLCPGYAPKIELGLFYLGYEGKVLLVNKDARSFADLDRFLSLFAPRFTTRAEARDLWREDVGRHRMVAANHVIDDLIVDGFAERLGIPAADVYEKEGCLVEVWDHILRDRAANLAEMTARIAGIFDRALAPGGKLAVAQYPSYIERVLDLGRVSAFNAEVLACVRDALVAGGCRDLSARAAAALAGEGVLFGGDACFLVEKSP